MGAPKSPGPGFVEPLEPPISTPLFFGSFKNVGVCK